MHTPHLKGTRCSLVPMSEAYLERHVELLQNPEVTRYLRFSTVSVEGQRAWMHRIMHSGCDMLHAVTVPRCGEDVYIGLAQLKDIDLRDGVAHGGLVIADTNYWGRGIGSEARNLHLACAFRELKLRWVFGRTASGNVRAQRLMESLGYVRQGLRPACRLVDNEFQDEILYGISREKWTALNGRL